MALILRINKSSERFELFAPNLSETCKRRYMRRLCVSCGTVLVVSGV